MAGANDDEDFFMLTAMHSNLNRNAAQMAALLAESCSDDSGDDDAALEDQLIRVDGPGRGNTAAGFKRAYVRTPGKNPMRDAREHHDKDVFQEQCGFPVEDFDALYAVAEDEIGKEMDPREKTAPSTRTAGRETTRAMTAMEMLYFFLVMMTGPVEGSYGVGHMRLLFGVSRGTISNVFYHAAGSLHSALKALRPCLIQWPDPAFRAATKGLINGFPEVVVFVDGSKQRVCRPGDPVLQEFIYDGHHHFHAYTVLFWCDVFGRCVRLDFTLKGSMHDREIYNNTAVGQNPDQFFTRDALGNFTELVMGDSGFQGHGPMEAPCKGNQAANFTGRGARNGDNRKQRICNEWGIGQVNNKLRMFLGRWSMSKAWFPITYEVAAMIIVFTDHLHDRELVPLSRLLERQASYNATGGDRY